MGFEPRGSILLLLLSLESARQNNQPKTNACKSKRKDRRWRYLKARDIDGISEVDAAGLATVHHAAGSRTT